VPATRLLLIFAVLAGSAVAVAPPALAAPAPVRPDVQVLRLDTARTTGEAREVLRQRTFSMVAVRWRGERPERIEVQAQRPDGRWGAWTELEPMASSPDRKLAPSATEPLWVGESRGVRVRSESGTADAAKLDVVLIDAGRAQSDASPVTTQAVGRPAVISRAAWGADEGIRCMDAEYMPTVKAATIHHTAGTNDYTQADSAAIVRGIYVYHAQTLGWCDIGYNALVDKYGQIFEGAYGGLDRAIHGAHAGGFNDFTFGVSMMGLYNGVAPTDVQLESVSRIVAWKLAGSYRNPRGQVTLISTGGGTSKYPAGTAVNLPVIFAHRDVGNTECPGNIGYQQLPRIRDRVAALVGDWTNTPIYRKWQALGGEAGPAGSPHRVEQPAANGGLFTGFSGGAWGNTSIYWSSATNAHEVHGLIAQRYAALGAERGVLGYPTTDEAATADSFGRYTHFQNGSIYYSPSNGAHEVHGAIRTRWAQLGWERSYLGYPKRGPYAVPGGLRADFQFGYIELNQSTGQVIDRPYRMVVIPRSGMRAA
jgi:uncharacterized protein with LGFP repeats